MANIKSSKRDIRRIAKNTLRNRQVKSKLKTLAKKVQESLAADENVRKAAAIAYVSAVDKAAKRGIIHKNKASRCKSNMTAHVFGEKTN
jgi:small subunit ribosomal protein S20